MENLWIKMTGNHVHKVFISDWGKFDDTIIFFVRNGYRVWTQKIKDLNGRDTDAFYLCYEVVKP